MTPPDEQCYFWRNILEVAREEWSRRNMEEAMKAPPSDAAVRAFEAYKAANARLTTHSVEADQAELREAPFEKYRQAEIEAAQTRPKRGQVADPCGD
jgi:hypothetical protein